jgi:nitroimidazol reductase NimA-like FMN-containing flavoprotein (pyridoxamine 5'-phosphate oxidase superfamily)
MTHEEYQRAVQHWQEKDAAAVHMDRASLQAAIEQYIEANNTCALATGTGSFVRCTPIEYAWHDGCFWMFSEGGEKFIGLEQNPNVCLAIYDRYDGFGNLKGMQVMGTAEMIEPFSETYLAHAACKHIPEAALRKLAEPMNLIRVQPTRIDFLNSDFKKEGFGSRQELVLSSSAEEKR